MHEEPSLLAVDCVRRMLRSRSGQSDRLEDDDAGAGDPLPLSRGEGAPHHGQTENSRQAADFSRKRSANLKARNRAAAPRTWSGACFREVDGSFQKGTGPFQDRFFVSDHKNAAFAKDRHTEGSA